MSKRVVNPKTGAIPKQPRSGSAGASRPTSAGSSRPTSSGASRPGSGGAKATPSRGGKPPKCPLVAKKIKEEQKEKLPEPPPKAYENPAFSIPIKRVHTNPLLANKDRKKTIRRNIPPGEDTEGLKKIVLSVKKDKDISVGEFVSLVSQYTGDNGAVLRAVLTEDMNSFRKLARRIYDTMARDVSDVLTNQHIQLNEYEQEKTTLYTQKMMRAINEIYSYAPKFDFEQYYQNSDRYIASLFPIPSLIEADSDEAEMHRRQQAYHRLNWLRTEGDRLAAENASLQAKLNELKHEQKKEMQLAEARETEAEIQREELQAQEAAMQQQLEKLNDKVEETIIDTEAAVRMAIDESNMQAPVGKGPKAAGQRRRRKKQPEWVSDAAADIEEKGIEENIMAEATQAEGIEAGAVAGAVKRVRSATSKSKFKRPEPTTPERKGRPKKQTSPFHFSPIKTPPSKPPPPKEKSPFHFSPLKTPPPKIQVQKPPSPFHYSPPKSPQVNEADIISTPFMPPQLHTTRLRTERVTVQDRRPAHMFPQTETPAVRSQGLAVPTEEGTHETTPSGRNIATETPAAPQRQTTRPIQRPPHSRMPALETTHPSQLRGRQYAPRDSWRGFQ